MTSPDSPPSNPPPSPPPSRPLVVQTPADPPECPVCLEQYDETITIPRVLPCGHSTCDACLSRLHRLSSFSPPRTLRCPACTQLVSFLRPSSLPKNIDLLRFSLLTPRPNPKPPRLEHRRFSFPAELFSGELYASWKDWVLPHDAVSTDDHVLGRIILGSGLRITNEIIRCRLVDDQKVSLLEVGRFEVSYSLFEYSYVSKVMNVLNYMSDAQRDELSSILRVSVRVSRVCRVLGLWLSDENGCLYLVSEKMNDGLLDLSERNQVLGTVLGTVGVELCEVLISLQKERFVCGCLGLSCICFDVCGRVHVDLSEVLVRGRTVRESVAKGLRGRRKLNMNGSGGDDFVVDMSKMDVFVSPEVMLELLCREGVELEKNDLSCTISYGSDVWLLACVLLRLVLGNGFVEGICNYLKAVLDGTSEGASKCSIPYKDCVDKVNASFGTMMSSDSTFLLEFLVKCLESAPDHRPPVTDVWKKIKTLNGCQFMKHDSNSNMALMAEDICQCLALSKLCNTSKSVKNESSTSNLNKDCNDGKVNPGQTGEVRVDDVVKELVTGKLQCKDLQGHLDSITGLCAGGGFLFSSCFDKTVNIWSLQDFTHMHTFRGHEHRVMAVVFVDQEKPLCISADSGGGIFVWEVIQPFGKEPLKKWYEEKDWRYSGIHALAFSESGHLYTGSGDRLIKAWSLTDHTLLCCMEGHKSVVSSLALSNGVLYSGSWDGTVRLWSLHDHSPLAVFGEDSPGIVSSVLCLCAEQNIVTAAYEKGHLQMWMNDVPKSSEHIHNGATFALAMKESWLFSGGRDRTLKIQEVERGGADTHIRDIGSIACDSVITALMFVQGILFVGFADRLIKAFHCRS